ncbi:MAG: HEAT repeat domain-containing protein [Sedimentisphaerales bacterium]|nr:HEAT repeat domain-containing protein [Sedimentisphaerales bacterium]
MKKEYRIQIADYNSRDLKSMQKCDENSYDKAQNAIFRYVIVFLAFVPALTFSGCGQKVKNPKQGLSETQIEAHRIIREALSSDNILAKINAIEIAATTRQENYMPTITQLLNDPYVPVRFAASVAVGEMQHRSALKSVNQLLRDNDPNVIIAASYAMARLGYPEYLKILHESAINNENPTIKANSALLLGKIGDRSATQLLYQLLKDPRDIVAYQAAEALAMLGDVKIYEKIWAMLISAFADIKITGIRSMGALGTVEAENALVSMLSDPVIEVRLAAAGQLGKMGNRKGQNVVLEVFKKNLSSNQDYQSRERINTLTALAIGEIGTKNLTKFLPELMKNESPFVRLAAAKAVFQSSLHL